MSEKCPQCGKKYSGELFETPLGGYGCPNCAGIDPNTHHELIYRSQSTKVSRLVKAESRAGQFEKK